jgi:anaerobic dimethyl sulfoxide reductase subunit B
MACVVACQDQNDFAADDQVTFRHVTKYEEGKYPNARIFHFSLSCQHCGDAPCIMVCPTGAISRKREDGSVIVNRDLCIGCHSCELACPFGAPAFPDDGKMAKCDFCFVRREGDMKPACIHACPAHAIEVGPLEELRKRKADKASVLILKSLLSVNLKDA